MSRRTVLRARDEGGYFGLMQLGREIISSLQVYFWYSSIHSLQFVAKQIALGFRKSSDGTGSPKIYL